MPQLEKIPDGGNLAVRLGGSVIYKDHVAQLQQEVGNGQNLIETINWIKFNPEVIHGFIGWCREITQTRRQAFVIVGGGVLARLAIEEAKLYGNGEEDIDQQHHVGNDTTRLNASRIKLRLKNEKIPVTWLSEHSIGQNRHDKGKNGIIRVRGGIGIKHTSDYTAVWVAAKEGIKTVLKIGTMPGLYPKADNGVGYAVEAGIVEEMTISQLLAEFPAPQETPPGYNFIFEQKAAQLAREHGINVVLIDGDFGNVAKVINGLPFRGTILRGE